MKYQQVEWSQSSHDFVPVTRRPRKLWAGLLEPVGNVIGTALLFFGIVMLIAILHYA